MTFLDYKNKHEGETGILFAPGPTLNLFDYECIEEPANELVQIGINSVIYNDNLNLDYYFSAHENSKKKIKERKRLGFIHPLDLIKTQKIKQLFCATTVNGRKHKEHCSNKHIEGLNAIPFDVYKKPGLKHFHPDIHKHSFYNRSTAFPAIQFSLYTGIHKLYLVGHDCGSGLSYLSPDLPSIYDEYFTDKKKVGQKTTIDVDWRICNEFARKYYRHANIVSINPVGLKGLFTDIYSDSNAIYKLRMQVTPIRAHVHANSILSIRNHDDTRKYLHNSNTFSKNDFMKWVKEERPQWYVIIVAADYRQKRRNTEKVIGYIRTSIEDGITYVGVDIHPEHRQLGYAKQAYEKIFSMLKGRGKTIVGLAVLDTNQPAINLYNKLGFFETSRELVQGKPSIVMRKKL